MQTTFISGQSVEQGKNDSVKGVSVQPEPVLKWSPVCVNHKRQKEAKEEHRFLEQRQSSGNGITRWKTLRTSTRRKNSRANCAWNKDQSVYLDMFILKLKFGTRFSTNCLSGTSVCSLSPLIWLPVGAADGIRDCRLWERLHHGVTGVRQRDAFLTSLGLQCVNPAAGRLQGQELPGPPAPVLAQHNERRTRNKPMMLGYIQ